MLKPSDTTPVSSLLLAEVAAEFFPPGVFNVICGDRGTGRAMIAHDIPAMASITGSVRAGMEVARTAADGLKRVHLELGGKAPVIVFDDADVAEAAKGIAAAGYYNAGQDCTAATRVLAGPGIAADLTDALAEQARSTRTGGLDVADAFYGPLNSSGQLARVAGFLDRAPAHATVHAGGHPLPGPGYLFEPTVVSGLGQDDELVQDEVFGPVITVQRFTDEDQAVRWANGVKYGLGSSVWTSGPRTRDARLPAAGLRRRLDQHPHPVHRRDAARGLQALRLRQGPVDVRLRGLHADQARHVLHRCLARFFEKQK